MRSRGPIIGDLNRKLQDDAVFGKWRRFRFSGSIAGYRGDIPGSNSRRADRSFRQRLR
jgi:hypothetical protein